MDFKNCTFGILCFIILAVLVQSQGDSCSDKKKAGSCCDIDGCSFLECEGNLMCMSTENITDKCNRSSDVCNSIVGTPTTVNPNATTDVVTTQEQSTVTDANHSSQAPTQVSTESPITGTNAPTTEGDLTTVTQPPPTNATTVSPTTPASCAGQHFDAASFVGGIVLCGGLLTIGFFIMKFWKSRKGGNEQYHQF